MNIEDVMTHGVRAVFGTITSFISVWLDNRNRFRGLTGKEKNNNVIIMYAKRVQANA
jgi:hypothetical protein